MNGKYLWNKSRGAFSRKNNLEHARWTFRASRMAMCARCYKIISILMKMVLLSGPGLRPSVRNWFGSSLEPLRGSPLGSLWRRTPGGIGATAARRSPLRAVRGGHLFKGLVTAASHVSARPMDAQGLGPQPASFSLLFGRRTLKEAQPYF